MAIRWYVVHVFSGSEKKVAQAIREQAVSHGLEDQIEDVLVPTEEVTEMRRGAKVQSERKFFPGYILVKMELTDQSWQSSSHRIGSRAFWAPTASQCRSLMLRPSG